MTQGAEHIISIRETHFRSNEDDSGYTTEQVDDCYLTFEGFVITTNRQRMYIGISQHQSCCEWFGYFMSEDDPQSFVGAKLMEVKVTDTALNTEVLERVSSLDQGGVMFVTLETDQGTLQFVCYNGHNGYYGHTAVVWADQVQQSAYL